MEDKNLFNIGDIILVHRELIKRYGGVEGIRDNKILKYATQKPYMTAFGEDLFPTVVDKLASFLESIIKNHPFNDGNKRTAYHVVKNILIRNGYNVNLGYDQARPFLAKIATNDLDVEEISEWLESLTSKPIKEEEGDDLYWIREVPSGKPLPSKFNFVINLEGTNYKASDFQWKIEELFPYVDHRDYSTINWFYNPNIDENDNLGRCYVLYLNGVYNLKDGVYDISGGWDLCGSMYVGEDAEIITPEEFFNYVII